MEYLLTRALELARLGNENIFTLHEKEKEIGRCFMPFEIQRKFRKEPLKDTWNIPELEAPQVQNAMKIRRQLRNAGCFDNDISPIRVGSVHGWDDQFLAAFTDDKFDFEWRGSQRRRVSDSI